MRGAGDAPQRRPPHTADDNANNLIQRDDVDEMMQLLSEAERRAYAELLAPIDDSHGASAQSGALSA